MKELELITENKVDRSLINNQRCKIALQKGYKYNKTTGEIIGQRKRVLKAHINGYTIISFVIDGEKNYLYGTTFIEYFLKNENDSISTEEIELAKLYVKPSALYLQNKRILKESKFKDFSALNNFDFTYIGEQNNKPIHVDYQNNSTFGCV